MLLEIWLLSVCLHALMEIFPNVYQKNSSTLLKIQISHHLFREWTRNIKFFKIQEGCEYLGEGADDSKSSVAGLCKAWTENSFEVPITREEKNKFKPHTEILAEPSPEIEICDIKIKIMVDGEIIMNLFNSSTMDVDKKQLKI